MQSNTLDVIRKRRPPIRRHSSRFYRAADLCERWGISRITLWSWWGRLHILPRPGRLGPNMAVWPCEVIEEFERSRGLAPRVP